MLSKFKIFNKEIRRYSVSGAYRYFFRWKRSLEKNASSINDKQPWITYKVIDYLDKTLQPDHTVFEYGGGGSTLFFASRVSEVITIEHNEEWFKLLSENKSLKDFKGWKGKFIAATKGELHQPVDRSDPEHYSSDDIPSKGYNYKNYASAIDAYPDNYFGCVLVDGRSRPACLLHAIPKIKQGGLLVLDNSDRDYYLPQVSPHIKQHFRVVIDDFGPSPYSQDFTKTTVWKKI